MLIRGFFNLRSFCIPTVTAMRRLYTVVQSFYAKSADGEPREFKPGTALWCDLQQSGDEFKFETAARLEWFVDRQTFERCCVLTRPT
jgi:hypothetical protein